MKKIVSLSLLFTSLLFGAGYQIPNNSINSYALATANVANANGADTAYYNPANMVYNENQHEIEGSLSFVSLSAINYKSTGGTAYNIDSKDQQVLIPSLHYVSNALTDTGIRVGFSLITPAGLSREWTDLPAITTGKKYAMKAIELNPSIAVPITKDLSIAVGIRYLIASADVNLGVSTLNIEDAEADALGYNIALTYKVSDNLNLAITYRSDVTLDFKGSASIAAGAIVSDVTFKVPVPDNLIFAAAYSFTEKTTLEATYDITMWSRVKETNFDFAQNLGPYAPLEAAKPNQWRDTYAYRLGLTHKYDDDLTLMGGLAYNTNAAEEQYVSFSSTQTDSITFATGMRYKLNDALDIGLALLYAQYKDRTSNNGTVEGTLSNKNAYSITTGIAYKF